MTAGGTLDPCGPKRGAGETKLFILCTKLGAAISRQIYLGPRQKKFLFPGNLGGTEIGILGCMLMVSCELAWTFARPGYLTKTLKFPLTHQVGAPLEVYTHCDYLEWVLYGPAGSRPSLRGSVLGRKKSFQADCVDDI